MHRLACLCFRGHQASILSLGGIDDFCDFLLPLLLFNLGLFGAIFLAKHHFTHVVEPGFHFVHLGKFIERFVHDFDVAFALIPLNLNTKFVLQLKALKSDSVILKLLLQHLVDINAPLEDALITHSFSWYDFDTVNLLKIL